MKGTDTASQKNKPEQTEQPAVPGTMYGDPVHLRSILDATHDAFFLIDRQFKLLTYNRAFSELVQAFSGKQPAEYIDIFELLSPHNQEVLKVNFHRVLNGEFLEMENMTRRDPPAWFHIHLYPIQDDPGTPVEGITVCIRDITSRKLAESQSEEMGLKYKSLIENAIDANYQFNLLTSKFEYFSPVIESISGFKPAEITRWSHEESLEFIHPDDRQIMLDALKAADVTGKVTAEYRCRKKNGEYAWVINQANLLKDGHGQPATLVGSIRDINKQKMAEISLHQSEEEYRALVENSLDATYHMDLLTNRFVYISPVMEKISGYTVQEISAWTPEENLSHVHPDDITMLHTKMELATRTGRLEAEYRSRRKDGQYVWVSNTSNIIRDQHGKPLLSIGSIRDITSRKETENALIQREQQYRSLVEHASEGIVILNTQGSLIEANSHIYEMLGYSREEFAQRNLLKLIQLAPGEPPLRMAEVQAGFTVVQERNVLKSNDEKLQVELSCKMLPDFRILVIVRDLSERNLSKKILQEKENTFQHLFNYSNEGFFIGDEKGFLTDVNEAGCKLLGYPKDEILGRNVEDFIAREPGQGLLVLDSLRPGKSIIFSRRARNNEGKIRILEINAIRLPDNRLLGITHDVTEKREEHKRIADSKARFRTLFENSMEGIMLNDDSGKIIAVNPAICRMFGMAREEMIGMPRESLTPLDKEKMTLLVHERRLKGHATGRLTFRKRDGRTFETMISSSQFLNEEGKICAVVNIHDLTEQLKMESDIRESEAKFRKMFDVATVATVVAKTDGWITDTNDAFADMLQYSKEELKTMNFLSFTHPDDMRASTGNLDEVVSG